MSSIKDRDLSLGPPEPIYLISKENDMAYRRPNVLVETIIQNTSQNVTQAVRPVVLVGAGKETVTTYNVAMRRGSASDSDTYIPQEDMTGRAVTNYDEDANIVTLGDYNLVTKQVQVRNFPIVTGAGTGTVSNNPGHVQAVINGEPAAVLSVNGAMGFVTLSVIPEPGDVVELAYHFRRQDVKLVEDLTSQINSNFQPSIDSGRPGDYVVTATNNQVSLVLNGLPVSLVIPPGTWTATQVAAFLQTATTGLTVSSVTYANGKNYLRMVADASIEVADGSANGILGLSSGTSSSRDKTFKVQSTPIVTGSGGGVITTNPSNIVVEINGQPVDVTSVNGTTGVFSLRVAPSSTDTLSVTYYSNRWQDSFDYLPHANVLSVNRVGLAPNRNDFIEGTDFVLQDDRIVWGAATIIEDPENTGFDIVSTVIDDRYEMAPATVAVNNRSHVILNHIPTLGNGKNTPLTQETYNTYANDRAGVTSDIASLISVYWGYSFAEALASGPRAVSRVLGSDAKVVLVEPVPAGAEVYASYYAHNLTDANFDVVVVTPGVSGIGTYEIINESGPISKSSGLDLVTLNFPSGSEFSPGIKHDVPFDPAEYNGPIEETVTVTFGSNEATPAEMVFPYAGPYNFVPGSSDQLTVNSTPFDFNNPYLATVVSQTPVEYESDTGFTTFPIDSSNNALTITLDGVTAVISVPENPTGSASDYTTAINDVFLTSSPVYKAATYFDGNAFTIQSGQYNKLTFEYIGDVNNAAIDVSIAVADGAYPLASLAATMNTQFANAIAALSASYSGMAITVSSGCGNRLKFEFTRADSDTYGTFTVKGQTVPIEDLSTTCGVSLGTIIRDDSVVAGTIDHNATIEQHYTRAYIQGRLLPQDFWGEQQTSIDIPVSEAARRLGIGQTTRGGVSATSRRNFVEGWLGQEHFDTLGTGLHEYIASPGNNDTYNFKVDGEPKTVILTSGPLGPVSDLTSVAAQFAAQGMEVDIIGNMFRLYGAETIDLMSVPTVNDLNLVDGTNDRSNVRVSDIVGSLMTDPLDISSGSEPKIIQVLNILAAPNVDENGYEYLYLIELDMLGTMSFININDSASTVNPSTVGLFGTGFYAVQQTNRGLDALQTVIVTSSNPNGSGSINSNSNGIGQEGHLDATYIDRVTGVSFTLNSLAGNAVYPDGESFTFVVSSVITTDSQNPVYAIPGIELIVQDTVGLTEGDTVQLTTYRSTGAEPNIGDTYYITYTYRRRDFEPRFYSKIEEVVAIFGEPTPENPVSMAAKLALDQGISAVAIAPIDTNNTGVVTNDLVRDKLQSLRGRSLPGYSLPAVIVPVLGVDKELAWELTLHADKQSNKLIAAPRTILAGVESGTTPTQVAEIAEYANSMRFRLVYPENLFYTYTDSQGQTTTYTVGSYYLAAALAGRMYSSNVPVSTPYARQAIRGLFGSARRLETSEVDELLSRGVMTFEDKGNGRMLLPDGRTTAVRGNLFEAEPENVQITDEIDLAIKALVNKTLPAVDVPSWKNETPIRITRYFESILGKNIKSFETPSIKTDPNNPRLALITMAFKIREKIDKVDITHSVSLG
jgi:hypothetical protein